MMVDFALEAERKDGKPPVDAIYQACLLRFRPILMTTLAALLGALPERPGGGCSYLPEKEDPTPPAPCPCDMVSVPGGIWAPATRMAVYEPFPA
jgi:hypothetical protein